MIEWMLVMMWWTEPQGQTHREILYGPGKTWQMRNREDCEHARKIREDFLQSTDWPYKNTTRFVCESYRKPQ